MRIYLANKSEQKIGGGFTFLRNYAKYSKLVTESYEDADVFMVSGATMIPKEDIEKAKQDGKKIVLRVDNIPRNSRNRNTGTSRLKKYSDIADLVIYQSEWARAYIIQFLKKDGPVILNGADTDIFNKEGPKIATDGSPQYLYARFNRDETKRWEEAWYHYQLIQKENPEAFLWIVGQFSDEQRSCGFDFFREEKYRYWGILNEESMAMAMRSCDRILIPYWNDACSNTLIEAILCGADPVFLESGYTGGAPEIMCAEDLSASRMAREYDDIIKTL